MLWWNTSKVVAGWERIFGCNYIVYIGHDLTTAIIWTCNVWTLSLVLLEISIPVEKFELHVCTVYIILYNILKKSAAKNFCRVMIFAQFMFGQWVRARWR